MSEETRSYTENQCRKVFEAYVKRIKKLSGNVERLSETGKTLVTNYEKNIDSERELFNKALKNNEFFSDFSDEELLKIAKYCFTINKNFKLRVKFDSEITRIIHEIDINLSSYKKSWIIVKYKNSIQKIIYNFGNGIIFVNDYGEIIEEIPFEPELRKTEFLNKYLGINNAEQILRKAGYTYENGLFVPKNGSKRAFNLNGEEVSLCFKNRSKKESKHKKSVNSKIYNKQKDSIIWNRDTMSQWKAIPKKDDTGNIINEWEKTSCSDFLPVYLKSISEKVAKDVLGEENFNKIFKYNKTVVANDLIDFFSSNFMLTLIKGSEFKIDEKDIPSDYKTDDNYFKTSDKICAAKKAIIAQKYANNGQLIIATTEGHVAVVVKSSNVYSCYPEKRWKEDKSDPFLNGDGNTPHQGRSKPQVLYDFPVFLQAGKYTGVVNPGNAMGRAALMNDNVKYFLYKGELK